MRVKFGLVQLMIMEIMLPKDMLLLVDQAPYLFGINMNLLKMRKNFICKLY